MKKSLLFSIIGIFLYTKLFSFPDFQEPGLPPAITLSTKISTFEVGKGPVSIDSEIVVTDEDSEVASRAKIRLTNRPDGGNEFINISPEIINLADENGLDLTYSFTTGQIEIIGEAGFDLYQQIFRQFKYNNLSDFPDNSDRLVDFTIYDLEGTESVTKSKIVKVKNVTAVILNIEVPEEGSFKTGDQIEISLEFNQPVFVENGIPQLLFNLDGDEALFDYKSGSGSNQLVFQYTVNEGDFYIGAEVEVPEFILGESTIRDANEENADLSINSFPSLEGILLDGINPYVAQIDLPEMREYGLCEGDSLVFGLKMNEEVSITGESLVLQIAFESGVVEALYNPEKSNNEVLVFQYKVQPGDRDLDGPVINSLVLNGTIIQDGVGNAFVDSAFSNSEIPTTAGILIDTEAPPAPTLGGVNPDTGSLDNDGLSNTNEITLVGESNPKSMIKVFVDGDQVGTVEADENGQWEMDLSSLELEEGKYSLTATATDKNCNESEQSAPFNLELDLTAPEVITQNITLDLSPEGTVSLMSSQINNGTSDNVSEPEALTYSINKESFNCEDKGDQEVELKAVDEAGNEGTNTAVVTVQNTNAPTFGVQNVTIALNEEGAAELSPKAVYNEVSSVCYSLEQLEFELDRSSFGCNDLGDNSLTLTVTDPDGNSTSHDFVLTVEDNIAPGISGTPEEMEVFGGISGEYEVPDFLADMEATDNCSVQEFKQTPEPGTLLSGYNEPHTISFIATDASGNEVESSTTVVIKSNVVAEVTDPELISVDWGTPWEDLDLPEEMEISLTSGEPMTVQVLWEPQEFEPKDPGAYQNTGTLELPEGYLNPENIGPTISILVGDKLPPEYISLSNYFISVESEVNDLVGEFTTQDPMDDEHTYMFHGEGEDNQYFKISGDNLYWNTSEILPNKEEFNIKVTSTDVEGNSVTAVFVIHRTKPGLEEMEIPNVFSPNNDGINDEWGVKTLNHYSGVKIMVFEKSGRLLFSSTDPMVRWDGKFNGRDVPEGSYFYAIEIAESGERRRGVLTLLRN
ncbi:gliding motility-associated C-terminal domain-containing protein [Echinicola jeungdonensis]|uniref:Gliding motility-associated C-terminal domain-containing protein n=1 Tax=Echinicola jeungdonensis TaxID=709343 RepID=A0ABV5J5W4_9BACT|nr:gliding motility-associated C-terminal domain-containing protein [Echinicola jeungdonensis]MDN3670084.1 gliding motility-associated C-terminal domain-containing protein [Echinicola jeungdonensis]